MKTTATEVVVALQFLEPLPHLNALQISAVASSFEDLPHYGELPVAGPMAYSLGQLDGSEPIDTFSPTFPRIALTSVERDRTFTFQGDRVTYSWTRTNDISDEATYPGFDGLLAELSPLVDRFRSQIERQTNEAVNFKVAEITYVNVLPTRTASNERIKLSSIFSFLAAMPGSPGVNGYFHMWNERLQIADGTLRIQINGPLMYAPDRPAASFTLAAAFLIADPINLDDELLAVRRRIGESYARVLVAESDL